MRCILMEKCFCRQTKSCVLNETSLIQPALWQDVKKEIIIAFHLSPSFSGCLKKIKQKTWTLYSSWDMGADKKPFSASARVPHMFRRVEAEPA